MKWATQDQSWEQPAANGSGAPDVMGPITTTGKVANPDEAGTSHEDSSETAKRNM